MTWYKIVTLVDIVNHMVKSKYLLAAGLGQIFERVHVHEPYA